MGLISLVVAVFLMNFCPERGSSAVTPVFVEKGKDVLLKVVDVDIPATFTLLIWKFNDNVLVTYVSNSEPVVVEGYRGRIAVKNYSLNLKNLQEADSGVYIARVTGMTKENTLAEYNVTVQDPVSPVELTVDTVSKSAELCVVTVTCSTQDSHHINSSFTCDTETCRQEDGRWSTNVTTSGASLRLYLSNDLTIICNHSNQVSVKSNMTRIKPFCHLRAESGLSELHIGVLVAVVIILIVIIIILTLVYHLKKRKKKAWCERDNAETTVYAVPLVLTTSPSPEAEPTAEAKDESVFSLYAQVEDRARS